jgi:hypothetical protein
MWEELQTCHKLDTTAPIMFNYLRSLAPWDMAWT